jgi:hypothetical protein
MVDGNPAKPQPIPLKAGQTADSPITLQPGWNPVILSVQAQRAKNDPSARREEDELPRDKGERKVRRSSIAEMPTTEASGIRVEAGATEETWIGFVLEQLEIVTQPIT